ARAAQYAPLRRARRSPRSAAASYDAARGCCPTSARVRARATHSRHRRSRRAQGTPRTRSRSSRHHAITPALVARIAEQSLGLRERGITSRTQWRSHAAPLHETREIIDAEPARDRESLQIFATTPVGIATRHRTE